jgi:hypothetical protein
MGPDISGLSSPTCHIEGCCLRHDSSGLRWAGSIGCGATSEAQLGNVTYLASVYNCMFCGLHITPHTRCLQCS